MERASMVTIDNYSLDELKRKALAWDELQKELGEMYAASIGSDMDNSLSLGNEIDITRAVPFDQTIIVTNLPPSIGGIELMYSFFAPGGIRYYRMFFESRNDTNSLTALITFASSDAAKNYLSYVSKCEAFFISERLPAGYNGSPGIGEYLKTSVDQKSQFFLRSFPDVKINPWTGVERVGGKLITGDEGGYCNVSQAINQGATRVLIISPGIEAKALHEELKHLVAVPELKIELNRFIPAAPPKRGMITIIRFCSVRDAVMVKSYLSLLKEFSGPNGMTVRYCKDPIDYPTEELGWHTLVKPKTESNQLTSDAWNYDAARSTTKEPELAPKTSTVPTTEVDNLNYLFYRTAGSDTENSDAESDLRELSFSLAKEAFRPHIPTSPHRGCFTTLCHTPAQGDHTPAQPESEAQPEKYADLRNHSISEEKVKLVTLKADDNVSGLVALINAGSGTGSDGIPKRPKYPHEIYPSQGRAAGKKTTDTLKKTRTPEVFGGAGRLRTAASSPDISRSRDAVSKVENTSDSLLLLDIEPTKPSFTNHEATLQKFRREEATLLNTQKAAAALAAEELRVGIVIAARNIEPEKQALEAVNLNQSQNEVSRSGELSWKEQPAEKSSISIDDNFLGGWGDDF